MFYKAGILPSALDNEEMAEILEINAAKPRDERAVNGAEWIHSLLHGGNGHVN